MNTHLLFRYIILLMALTGVSAVHAQTEKNWELGVGIGSIYGPDYRGSNEYRSYTAPIPYVIYHGKFLHSDRDGVRTNFFANDTIEFTLSAGAYIAPNANENTAREDMPQLGSTVELGPSINVRLSGNNAQEGWRLLFPWRAVFSIDSDKNGYIGSIFQPQLMYRQNYQHWSLSYRSGLVFGSNSYHEYYYSVTPQYVTEGRTAFDAHGGYSGFTQEISLSRALTINELKTRLAFFVRYDNLTNTAFEASPLVKKDYAIRGGIAFIWVIK